MTGHMALSLQILETVMKIWNGQAGGIFKES